MKIKRLRACFSKRGITRGKSYVFNTCSSRAKAKSPQEISEIAFDVFAKKPLKVEFFSQSKFNLNSYKVFYRKEDLGLLKCREVFSESSLLELKAITEALTEKKISIPKVIASREQLVFSPWVEGKTIKLSDFLRVPGLLEKLVKYQAAIHSCLLPIGLSETILPESRYLKFLTERFIFFGSKYVKTEELVEVVAALKKKAPPLTLSIIHPDFTDDNIVLQKQEEPILIDNETLSVDLGYEFGILVAADSFFPESNSLQKRYFSLYKSYHSLGTLETHPHFWRLVYWLKSAGSNFQRGNCQKGLRFLAMIKKGLNN